MKTLEVFSPKDIRTCARLLKRLEQSNFGLTDLHSYAEHIKFLAKGGGSLIFGGVLFENEEINILNGLGWQTLKTWLRIKKNLDKAQMTEKETKTFVKQERKKWLLQESYGGKRP